ncbi:MAG: response regulator, partial [candidate division KSB1 bacterium]|nr:response regulator [candidate division KSB1 bacterium]
MEKKKVLIVDSQPNYVVGLKKGLIEAGYEISLAEDGDKALELTKRWQPDIILSEVTLPHLDGYHFFEALKSEPITRMI